MSSSPPPRGPSIFATSRRPEPVPLPPLTYPVPSSSSMGPISDEQKLINDYFGQLNTAALWFDWLEKYGPPSTTNNPTISKKPPEFKDTYVNALSSFAAMQNSNPIVHDIMRILSTQFNMFNAVRDTDRVVDVAIINGTANIIKWLCTLKITPDMVRPTDDKIIAAIKEAIKPIPASSARGGRRHKKQSKRSTRKRSTRKRSTPKTYHRKRQ